MTIYNPKIHHRRSIRLKGYDYTQPGAFFVTLVTSQLACLFGEIADAAVLLNAWGFLAMNEWLRLGKRFGKVIVDEFIVMPNHVHGILVIVDDKPTEPIVQTGDESRIDVGAGQETPILSENPPLAPPLQTKPTNTSPLQDNPVNVSLGAIVGAYKSTTARLINGLRRTLSEPVWQRNYYEHIIRDEAEFDRIRQYIRDNPLKWLEEKENPHRSR